MSWRTSSAEARDDQRIEAVEHWRDPGEPVQRERDQDGVDQYGRKLTRREDAA